VILFSQLVDFLVSEIILRHAMHYSPRPMMMQMMMRSSLAGVNIGIKVLLNSLRSGLSDVYLSRRYISSAKHIKEISFTCISESEEEVSKLGKVIDKKRKENSSAFRPNLLQSGVMQLRTEDIELGEGGGVGHIIVAAGEDLNVLYLRLLYMKSRLSTGLSALLVLDCTMLKTGCAFRPSRCSFWWTDWAGLLHVPPKSCLRLLPRVQIRSS
jgi:hypothetical protein